MTEGDAAEEAGVIAEGWGDDEVCKIALKWGVGEVAIEEFLEAFSDHREELALVHDAAAEDDSLGRGDGEEVEAGLGEGVGFDFPGGVIGGEFLGGFSPAGFDGGAGGEAFEAILVKSAVTFKGVIGVSGNAHVAHLGVAHAVDEFAIDHDRTADAGSDGEVAGIF